VRWDQARREGKAPPVVLAATNELAAVNGADATHLLRHAVDGTVPNGASNGHHNGNDNNPENWPRP